MVRVFVYGTLGPGQAHYQDYCADRVQWVQPAYTYGQLYALPVGYPALTQGRDRVWGHLLTFPDAAILAQLDDLEDFEPDRPPEQNEYERCSVPVYDPMGRSLGQAWAYLMRLPWIKAAGGQYRARGCWP
ncbi:MAG: gamma-glutamylcyclotransferase family protein [Spirulinaceae cyanobacterium]